MRQEIFLIRCCSRWFLTQAASEDAQKRLAKEARKFYETTVNKLKDEHLTELQKERQKHAKETAELRAAVEALKAKLQHLLSSQLQQQEDHRRRVLPSVEAFDPHEEAKIHPGTSTPVNRMADVDAAAYEAMQTMTKTLMRHEKHYQRLQHSNAKRRTPPRPRQQQQQQQRGW